MTRSGTSFPLAGFELPRLKVKSIHIGLFAGSVACALALHLSPAAATPTEKVVHSFTGSPDGQWPYVNLINVNGVLYGTTGTGGANGTGGTVFSLAPKTGTETVLYSFCGQNDCPDGYSPQGVLVDVRGTLYGTTNGGGVNGYGEVFGLDPTTKVLTVLHSFGSGTDGQTPDAGMINVNGMLYGTTRYGGTNGDGTVFAVNHKTGAETVLYSFCSQQNCTDGKGPFDSVIDVNGTLYGTTASGGTAGYGTVFSLNLATGTETVLYSFCSQTNCADGQYPYAGLLDVNGTLYGTTHNGGAAGDGTLFAVDETTGTETVLYSFCSQTNCADGALPLASVTDINGTLYGTTVWGGTGSNCGSGCGTVFSFDPTTNAETVLWSFGNGTDGQNPYVNPLEVRGKLYGTTVVGGADGYGTIFVLKNF